MAAINYYLDSNVAPGGDGSINLPWNSLASLGSTQWNALTAAAAAHEQATINLKRNGSYGPFVYSAGKGGVAGYPVYVQAYGTGLPPVISPKVDITLAASWTASGTANVWQASVTATSIKSCQMGGIWGTKKASIAECAGSKYFWYFASNVLYVYSPDDTNPATLYGTVSPIIYTYGIINNNSSYVRYKSLWIKDFEQTGVFLTGTSAEIYLITCVIDSNVPGVGEPYNISVMCDGTTYIYRCDIMRGQNGLYYSGSTTPTHILSGNRIYANRNYGLYVNTGRKVTYSYNHFFANTISNTVSNYDISGGTDGGGNIYSWPAIKTWKVFEPITGLGVDDIWHGNITYINNATVGFSSRGKKCSVNLAVDANDASDIAILAALQSTYDQEMCSHGEGSLAIDQVNALTFNYDAGPGTTATVTVDGVTTKLTTSIDGVPELDIDYSALTIGELIALINTDAKYTATLSSGSQAASAATGLADIGPIDCKNTNAQLTLDSTRFVPNEMVNSKAWIDGNLGPAPLIFVYPANKQNATTQGYCVAAGYLGARGDIFSQFVTNVPKELLNAAGINLQNMSGGEIATIHGQSDAAIQLIAKNVVFKAAMWGLPRLHYSHPPGAITADEFGSYLDGIADVGGTYMSYGEIATYLSGLTRDGTTTFYRTTPSTEVDWNPTAISPTVNAGVVIAEVIEDIMGLAVDPVAPDIGAYEYRFKPYYYHHLLSGGGA